MRKTIFWCYTLKKKFNFFIQRFFYTDFNVVGSSERKRGNKKANICEMDGIKFQHSSKRVRERKRLKKSFLITKKYKHQLNVSHKNDAHDIAFHHRLGRTLSEWDKREREREKYIKLMCTVSITEKLLIEKLMNNEVFSFLFVILFQLFLDIKLR